MALFFCWQIQQLIIISAALITRLFTSQTNEPLQRFFGKKLVDANRPYTHNAPRNADEGCAEKRW
ncbi:hypothetical protein ACMU9X_003481, partial [Yersinia enterocolitica]